MGHGASGQGEMRSCALIIATFRGIEGKERGLVRISDKPMVEYVLESLPDMIDDVVIIVRGEEAAGEYRELAESYQADLHVSRAEGVGQLIASEMESSGHESFLVLPCDAPLLKIEFTTFLLEMCKKFSATIPRMSAATCYYLFSSYRSSEFIEAFNRAEGKELPDAVAKMRNVMFVNLNALRIFDEKLYMFTRVSTMADARRAERIIKSRIASSGR